jgi:predicted site-specific integrase-resolvase
MMIRVRIGVAAEMIGVSIKTVQRWDASGKISCTRTAGGHRRVSLIEIRRITGETQAMDGDGEIEAPGEPRSAVYCRVSSHEQKAKGDLDRQVQVAVKHCTETGSGNPRVYTDVGSGLNANRGGLKRLCKAIERGLVQRVVVTYKDRLTRFGFGYLDRYFKSHGTSITVLRQSATRSMHEELVDDLIAIVTSFSGRVHGMRGWRKRSKPFVDVEMFTIERLVKREISKAINIAVRRIVAI